jgi:hypothetical protein
VRECGLKLGEDRLFFVEEMVLKFERQGAGPLLESRPLGGQTAHLGQQLVDLLMLGEPEVDKAQLFGLFLLVKLFEELAHHPVVLDQQLDHVE